MDLRQKSVFEQNKILIRKGGYVYFILFFL